MEEKTDMLKGATGEGKDRQWKSFCSTLSRDTTLAHFWQFHRQIEGSTSNTTIPDLIDSSRATLKTSKEKGSTLLHCFVPQSNQNNLDEKKVWKGLDKTLIKTGSSDDLITELEVTEALSGLSKDTAPGPDMVKYSNIKNLSVHNKSEVSRLHEESFETGQDPEDWSHSYPKPVPKPGKHNIPTINNTTRKLMERIMARKLAQDLERRNGPPSNLGGYFFLSYLSRSLADRWATTADFRTSFLHSSRFLAFRSSIFHSRPVHSLILSSHRFLCLPLRLPP